MRAGDRWPRATAGGKRQTGATYMWLLLVVALLGTGSARVVQSWAMAAQRQKEEQLLLVGAQYRQAIASYYEATPGPHKQLPTRIDDLLRDPRFAQAVRHLRQRYVDPMTGLDDWQLVSAPGGGLLGVRSRSQASPLRRAGFEATQAHMNDADHYADWYFVFVPLPLAGQVKGPWNTPREHR